MKKQIIEEAFQANKYSETKATSTVEKTCFDKAVGTDIKTKHVRTQYSISHCHQQNQTAEIRAKPKLVVKLPPKKKQRDISVNTDASFDPFVKVNMFIKQDDLIS